jgi:hypothetical protein
VTVNHISVCPSIPISPRPRHRKQLILTRWQLTFLIGELLLFLLIRYSDIESLPLLTASAMLRVATVYCPPQVLLSQPTPKVQEPCVLAVTPALNQPWKLSCVSREEHPAGRFPVTLSPLSGLGDSLESPDVSIFSRTTHSPHSLCTLSLPRLRLHMEAPPSRSVTSFLGTPAGHSSHRWGTLALCAGRSSLVPNQTPH